MALATSYKMKPPVSARLVPGHPLAHGVVGFWLLSEGSGGKAFDLSGNNNTGTLYNDVTWKPGKFGSCLDFAGSDDYVDVTGVTAGKNYTIAFWGYLKSPPNTESYLVDIQTGRTIVGMTEGNFQFYDGTAWRGYGVAYGPYLNAWHHYAFTFDGSATVARLYIDGILKGSKTTYWPKNIGGTVRIGKRYSGGADSDFSGRIDHLMILSGAAKASTVGWLYKQSFAAFGMRFGPSLLYSAAGQMVPLAGTSTASASVEGTLTVTAEVALAGTVDALAAMTGSLSVTAEVTLAGTIGAAATLYGSLTVAAEVTLAGTAGAMATLYGSLTIAGDVALAGAVDTASALCGVLTLYRPGPWFSVLLEIEKDWLIGALFGGMTANAFKLGTVLSLGWFWMRRSGCSALYRGPSMRQIDFANVLAVAAQDATSISPPVYVTHDAGSTYFYVVLRFNDCGHQEHTLAGAAKLVLGAHGDIAEPTPNSIFALRAKQIDADRVRLVWYYCPLEQKSAPACFNVYCDSGTGQIDYENPIAAVGYEGRKFHRYESGALGAGRYLFAVRAEDAAGVRNDSLARVGIQLSTTSPDAIIILGGEGA